LLSLDKILKSLKVRTRAPFKIPNGANRYFEAVFKILAGKAELSDMIVQW